MVRWVSVEGTGSCDTLESGDTRGSTSLRPRFRTPSDCPDRTCLALLFSVGDLELLGLISSREPRALRRLLRLLPLAADGLGARGAKLVTDDCRLEGVLRVGDVAIPEDRGAPARSAKESRGGRVAEGSAGGTILVRELMLGRGRVEMDCREPAVAGGAIPDSFVGDFTGDCRRC